MDDSDNFIDSVDVPVEFHIHLDGPTEEGEEPNHLPHHSVSPFSVVLNDSPQAAAIVLLAEGTEIARIEKSANVPTVDILSVPDTAAVTNGEGDFEWNATDGDGDEVLVNVLYTPDNGHNVIPLAVRL